MSIAVVIIYKSIKNYTLQVFLMDIIEKSETIFQLKH